MAYDPEKAHRILDTLDDIVPSTTDIQVLRDTIDAPYEQLRDVNIAIDIIASNQFDKADVVTIRAALPAM